MSLSSSCGKETPLAAHIFEYMPIVVNPGIVLTSLTNSAPEERDRRKSTLAMPAQSIAWNAATESR